MSKYQYSTNASHPLGLRFPCYVEADGKSEPAGCFQGISQENSKPVHAPFMELSLFDLPIGQC